MTHVNSYVLILVQSFEQYNILNPISNVLIYIYSYKSIQKGKNYF